MKGRGPARPATGALLLLLIAAAPVGADDYADFRIPAHSQLSWTASFSTAGNRSAGSQDSPVGSSHNHGAFLGASTSSSLSWLSDSDPALTSLFVVANFSGARRWEARSSLLDQSPLQVQRFEDSRSNRDVAERWQIGASQRLYPWVFPLGFSASVYAAGDYGQSWRHADDWVSQQFGGSSQVTTTRARDATWVYSHLVSTSLSLGVGRVRDATGVFETAVLEQRLLRAGALTRPLSSAARRRLAELIIQRSLGGVRERPARTVWQAVERILRDDGALSEQGLDGYSIMRAGEPLYGGGSGGAEGLPSSPVTRLRGCFVGPIVSDVHAQNLVRGHLSRFRQDVIDGTPQPPSELSSGFRSTNPFDQVLVGGRAEGHWPLGSRWQIDGTSQTLFPARKEESGLDLFSSASATLLVADRWLASAVISQNRNLRQVTTNGITTTFEDGWAWGYGVSANYYLEDRVNLTFGVSGSQGHSRFSGGLSTSSSHGHSFNLGLSYRFIGRYQANGLIEPIDVITER